MRNWLCSHTRTPHSHPMLLLPQAFIYADLYVRSRYQGQGQIITSHKYCGMYLLFPALDTCFWHRSPHMYLRSITTASQCLKIILEPTQPRPFICFFPLWNGLWYFPTYTLTHWSPNAIMQQHSWSWLATTLLCYIIMTNFSQSIAISHTLECHNKQFSLTLWMLQNVFFKQICIKCLRLHAAMFVWA